MILVIAFKINLYFKREYYTENARVKYTNIYTKPTILSKGKTLNFVLVGFVEEINIW